MVLASKRSAGYDELSPLLHLSMIYHLHATLSSALANLQIVESCPTWPLP